MSSQPQLLGYSFNKTNTVLPQSQHLLSFLLGKFLCSHGSLPHFSLIYAHLLPPQSFPDTLTLSARAHHSAVS